ncbi:hypothetical protein AQJ91_18245 [Streptomyces dysideae]|uniref:Uncharacterized protein n=1 Tax=Streptomyces dysideae TaxID=909626 RepID=A0A101UZL7_9ACTN|nr:hypothetical protein AQJ91_18245 [Streptomyces dysideae]
MAPDTVSMSALWAASVSWLSFGTAVEEISLLLGEEDGDWTAVAPVILPSVSVIRTWTGPYLVWAVAPVTVRVVGAADVVFGAEGAPLVLVGAGARDAERDADRLGLGEDEARSLPTVRAGVADADGDAVGEADKEASAVRPVLGAASAWASAGSVFGLSASSSTIVAAVAAPASTMRRSGCVFLTKLTAHAAPRVSPAQRGSCHLCTGLADTPAQSSKDS